MKKMLFSMALAALAGCCKCGDGCKCEGVCTCKEACKSECKSDAKSECKCDAKSECKGECKGKCNCADPVIGSWSLKLPYDEMFAGHVKFFRDAAGKPQATVLWRWASPMPVKDVAIEGDKFSFTHPWSFKVSGSVKGDAIEGEVVGTKDGKNFGKLTGRRNAPVCPKASTADAKFGKGIDLLADGLDGWKNMNPKAKFGWKIIEENGTKILSNCLGKNEKGGWAGGGANIMTKRADFYDFKLCYDVRVPAKSNSGVYLRGRVEIQVIDSYGKKPDCHGMCSLYGRVAPAPGAEKAPGEWQHVEVVLYKRHLTVELNGKKVIDNAEVDGVTGGAIDSNEFVPGPIYLQGDHSDADFKNMVLYPVAD